MNRAANKLPVWDIVDKSFAFTGQNFGALIVAAGLPVLGIEIFDYAFSVMERRLGLDDPNVALPRGTWFPIYLGYLTVTSVLSAIASIPVVRMALRLRQGYRRADDQVVQIASACFLAWLASFLVGDAFDYGLQLLIIAVLDPDWEITSTIAFNPWLRPFVSALSYALSIAITLLISFFAAPIAVVEGERLFFRTWELWNRQFWRVLMIGMLIEIPFMVAFSLVTLPFHGVFGSRAESVFLEGYLVTAPEIAWPFALAKHVLDAVIGLGETAAFVAASAFVYRALRPELEFE